MTDPKKSDHWNSLLDEIGVPVTQKPAAADETAQETVAQAMPPRPAPLRESPKPRLESKPAAKPPSKGSWSSLLGALGLAQPEEPAPPVAQPPAERSAPPARAPAAEYAERTEPVRSPLDEIKPSYRPDEPPFPSRRPRELVDDVAPDIDLDADFGPEPDVDLPPVAAEEETEVELPRGERQQEDRERGVRRRRRRRRGGRREEGAEAPSGERRVERPRTEPETDRAIESHLDFEEPDLDLADSDVPEKRAPAADEDRERDPRRRRRGGRGREGAAAGPSDEAAPPRRRTRSDAPAPSRAPHPRAEEDDTDLDDLEDVVAGEDEDAGEHAVHKRIPTWAETVGILIDANMAARSSRQPDRGRSRRPRRDR